MPALPPEFLAVLSIPSNEDGGDGVIMVELSEEHPKLLGSILRGLKAASEAA
jgi:hypothetical protein